MKQQQTKSTVQTELTAKELLIRVAQQYKGKDMFPRKTEQCKQFLRLVKGATVK
jgi:hypothetical protein